MAATRLGGHQDRLHPPQPACLSRRLECLNVPLLVVRSASFNGVPPALLRLARRHDCDAPYFNDEYEVNECRRDAAVCEAFQRAGLAVHRFCDQLILPPGEVRTKSGDFFVVYTPFKRAWMAALESGEDLNVLPSPRRQRALACGPDRIPESIKGFTPSRGLSSLSPRRVSVVVRNRG
jgi:deoxyribodipyrimidine photo-lyase